MVAMATDFRGYLIMAMGMRSKKLQSEHVLVAFDQLNCTIRISHIEWRVEPGRALPPRSILFCVVVLYHIGLVVLYHIGYPIHVCCRAT